MTTSLPNKNYASLDDIGSDTSRLKAPKPKVSFWKITTFFLLFCLLSVLALLVIATDGVQTSKFSGFYNPNQPTQGQNLHQINSEKEIDTLQSADSSYIWADSQYQVYFEKNSENYNTTIFLKFAKPVPKKTALFTLESFTGEIEEVFKSKSSLDDDGVVKFVMKTRFGSVIRYYLIGIATDKATGSTITLAPSELNFDTNYLEETDTYHTFDVISWIDDDRVLVRQTDIPLQNPADLNITYWIAPAEDLNRKTLLEL